MSTHIQSSALANGKKMGARMGSNLDGVAQIDLRFGPRMVSGNNSVCRDLENGAMLDLQLLLQEFRKLDFSHKTEALAVFFLCVGQSDFSGDAPHVGLIQFPHGKQSIGQLRLVDLAEKVALVLVGIDSGKEAMVAIRRAVFTTIVTSGHSICTQLHSGLSK